MATTRERILSAALARFTEQGVSGTTMEEVREDAGVSNGSLYHHFGDRQELTAAVHGWLLADYHAGFLDVLEAEADAGDGVVATVRYHLTWCTDHPDAARYLLTEPVPSAPGPATEMVHEENRRFLRRVLAWMRPHINYGALRALRVELAYPLWLGPSQERCRIWLTGRAPEPSADEVEVLATSAVRCLLVERDRR